MPLVWRKRCALTAADLAAIRKALPPDRRDAGDCPERAGVCWCAQNAAHAALARIEQNTLTPEEARRINKLSDNAFANLNFTAAERPILRAKLERIAGK